MLLLSDVRNYYLNYVLSLHLGSEFDPGVTTVSNLLLLRFFLFLDWDEFCLVEDPSADLPFLDSEQNFLHLQ